MIKSKTYNLIKTLFCFLLYIVGYFVAFFNQNYYCLAVISIVHLILSIVHLKICGNRVFSISCIFIACSFVFNCGQIINLGFKIDAENNLLFTNYGTSLSQFLSFSFYYWFQSLVCLTIGFSKITLRPSFFNNFNSISKKMPWVLLIIGIVPRIYCDIVFLLFGLKNGYQGSFAYIPQFINTLAFFADIAVILFIMLSQNKKRTFFLFLSIVLYKGFMMLSGNRQESFVFLIVLTFLFLFVKTRVKVTTFFTSLVIAYIGLVFIMTVGKLRSSQFVSVNYFMNAFFNNLSGGFVGDLLGEFGCSFSTLVKTVNDTPSKIDYGFGRSYIAGLLSPIPLLVKNIGQLEKTTTYITQYYDVSNFGGSYLGEFYYNFSWLGLLPSFLIGYILKRIDFELDGFRFNKAVTMRMVFAICLSISILLFVRGFFSDMVQKIVWLMLIVWIVAKFEKRSTSDGIFQCNSTCL